MKGMVTLLPVCAAEYDGLLPQQTELAQKTNVPDVFGATQEDTQGLRIVSLEEVNPAASMLPLEPQVDSFCRRKAMASTMQMLGADSDTLLQGTQTPHAASLALEQPVVFYWCGISHCHFIKNCATCHSLATIWPNSPLLIVCVKGGFNTEDIVFLHHLRT